MTENESKKSNVPEFSVQELAFSLKRTLEENFGRVRVRGELSRVSIAASGHMYSSLKDDQAVIDAVCWKGVMSKLSVKPEEGLEVICTGRISTYPQRSNYQLIIESMELAGEGALLKMLEERKKKLAAEGLFAPERKKDVPFLPKTIGVVTSPTGAVIRDILHRLTDRFPRDVLVWPVLVQGDGAAKQVAAAVRGFQTIHEHGFPKPDVLIVARGGGSLEDLMPFNEEEVVRAVADSEIPVISAVGHETDTTLCDFAADLRAPTPTGAAEMAVPVRAQLAAQVLDDEKRLVSAANRIISEHRQRIENLTARLGDPKRLMESQTQRLDHLGDKLGSIFKSYLDVKNNRLVTAGAQLRSPKERLERSIRDLDVVTKALLSHKDKLTEKPAQNVEHLGKMLEAYSFKNVLKRGFTVIRNDKGKIVSDGQNLQDGQNLEIEFRNDNFVNVSVGEGSASPKPKSKPKKKTANADQKSLFD
ncbi:MAG: exodeoxyribonuclease VII large subunit [Alphaproteobacteria bacterium]|nr:exodeoxyribonuclease VII large subunit [Alphaproteobacteria bacterium]